MLPRRGAVKLGDRRVPIASLRVGDIQEIEDWLKGQVLREASNEVTAIGGAWPEEQKADHLKFAIRQARRIRFGTKESESYIDSGAGVCFMLYLAAKRADPSVTWESFKNLDVGDLEAVKDELDRVSGLAGIPQKKSGEHAAPNPQSETGPSTGAQSSPPSPSGTDSSPGTSPN